MRKTKKRTSASRRICLPLLCLGFAFPPSVSIPAADAQAPPTGAGTRDNAPATRPNPTPDLKGRPVVAVKITGNATISRRLVENLIRTKKGDPFDPATVQDDYQRVFQLKKFSNVDARVEPTKSGGVIVIFQLTEQKLIHSVIFRGNRHISTDSLKKDIDVKPGQAIDEFSIAMARQTIANKYRDQNFPLSHVDVPSGPLSKTGDLIFDIVEGPKVRIRRVEFVGARSFDRDRLKKQVKTASFIPIFRDGKYDPDQVEEDVASLHKFYEDHGFFDVRVGRKLIFSPDETEMEVDFLIDEGVRYTIRNVSFEFNSHLGEARLREGLKLTPGQFWDQEKLQHDVKQLVDDYSPLGYIYVQGSTDEDYLRIEPGHSFMLNERGKVDLVYRIHEGKPFHLGQIFVKGNSVSQEKLVLREFRHGAPGTLYNSGSVQDAVARLRASGYFSSVAVTPIGDDPNYRDLLVEVTEGRTAAINLGAGINSNGGIGANVTYSQHNFDIAKWPEDPRDLFSDQSLRGGGQTFIASFEPGTIATNATLRFYEPYLFDQPYGFSEEVYLRDRIREHYDDQRLGNSVGITKRSDDNVWSAGVSLRTEEVKIYHVYDEKWRPEEILAARGHHDLTGATLSLRRETINPGFFPYTGTATSFGYEYIGAAGGDYHFHRLNLKWDGYQTVGHDLLDRKTVLSMHGFVGYIPGNSVFFERYYGGGIGSLRGFAFRGVSPRAGRGLDPVGGDFAATGTVELNFPLIGESFRGVVFTDVGDVEPQARFGTIRTSVGTGIRLTLPFLGQAPLAIDFAVPVTQSRLDEKQLISFSLGFSP